jgi:hypothetical protein
MRRRIDPGNPPCPRWGRRFSGVNERWRCDGEQHGEGEATVPGLRAVGHDSWEYRRRRQRCDWRRADGRRLAVTGQAANADHSAPSARFPPPADQSETVARGQPVREVRAPTKSRLSSRPQPPAVAIRPTSWDLPRPPVTKRQKFSCPSRPASAKNQASSCPPRPPCAKGRFSSCPPRPPRPKSRASLCPPRPPCAKSQDHLCPPRPARTKRRSHSNTGQNRRSAGHRPPASARFVHAHQGEPRGRRRNGPRIGGRQAVPGVLLSRANGHTGCRGPEPSGCGVRTSFSAVVARTFAAARLPAPLGKNRGWGAQQHSSFCFT